MKIFFILFISVFCLSVFGGEHAEGGMSPERTLFWNIFNFSIFFIGVFYVFKQKLAIFFQQKHRDVADIYSRAIERKKISRAQKLHIENKIGDLAHFEEKVKRNSLENLEKFKQQYLQNQENQIAWARKESENKLVATYKNGVDQLEKELMQEVVEKVEQLVASNIEVKKQVTDKIIGMIG